MTQESNLYVRLMRLEEKKVVHNIMSRSFPLVQRWFFSFTPHVLVAEQNGQLLGATVLKLIPLPGNRKGGLIYWVFTAPEARGMGAGQRLIEAALHFFEDKGCDEIMTCVEGFNTSSSKLFSTRGFSILSPGQQFRRYSIGILPLWVKIFHYIDIGHFLWARPGAEQPDNPALQWWGNVLMKTWINIAMIIGKSLALFDIALIFFPFASFNGRRIWDWNRVVWGVLAAAAVVVFFV